MVATQSMMRDLGETAPEFSLPDVTDKNQMVGLSLYQNQPLLVMFICNHCPFVIHVVRELSQIATEFAQKGFAVVAISSNDSEAYPQDGPDQMQVFADQHQFDFPYCFDQTQQTAKAYGATCTPDFFVFDRAHSLVYRGQLDDSRPSNGIPVSGRDLRAAMTATLNGEQPDAMQSPSIGCSIKWRQG